jgi:3-hydroxyacyl-[acyl-carrier-protein] dehydratase
MTVLTLRFAPDHPTATGHFPGNPIIPGALLLAEVLAAIAQVSGSEHTSCTVKSAKFPHPVRPGDSVAIAYATTASGAIAFDCTVTQTLVLSGVISVNT